MKTVVLGVDPQHPQPAVIEQAAEELRRGGLVAFPTETVYGLGADALSDAAVRRIFAAKGRPANNPVIVHVNDVATARSLTTSWPAAAARLAERHWPGPLTFVLPKAAHIPEVVTAGGPSVAIRMPAHPVARALIEATGRPLAAPSANPSTRISATSAEHVVRLLEGRVELVLDGGPTLGGLESTVVDLSGTVLSGAMPKVLRPGLISAAEIAASLGSEVAGVDVQATEQDDALPSPGLLKKHYSPLVPLYLTDDDGAMLIARWSAEGKKIGWIPLGLERPEFTGAVGADVVCLPLPCEPATYARRLYAVLHELEAHGVAAIVVERPPPGAEWTAIHDRLQRAAAK
jgi:L-threonylcarbamoyladenylate synthase